MAATEVELTSTATVSRRGRGKAKQDDLPTMEEHAKKVAEIEDLADVLVEADDVLAAAKEKRNDAMENLVASMKRHDKTFYARPTWGKVVLKESKTKAKVTKTTVKPSGDGDAEGDETESE